MAQITYADKSTMNTNSGIPATNKCQASDMNEIKSVVNSNYTELRNAIDDKNIITIALTSNFSIPTANTIVQVTGWSVLNSIGNKLTLSNNKIVIGSGVSKVLVSYKADVRSSGSAANTNVYLTHNNGVISQEVVSFSATNQTHTAAYTPRLLNVNQNDTIYLSMYGPKNNNLEWGWDNNYRTIITVEVVE